MRLLIKLDTPCSWEEFQKFVRIIEDLRDEFEVLKVEASVNTIQTHLERKESDAEEDLSDSKEEENESEVEREESEEKEVNADGWTELTDSMVFAIEDGYLRLGHKKDGKVYPVFRIPMDQLRKLYDRLPDEADSSDVRRVAAELNLSITGFETYIMRVLSRRAEFGGELIKEGRTLKLIKDSDYLREENRRRFEQEKQVIGTPWGAEA